MPSMSFKGLNKVYPNGVQAVFDFNLEVKDGEFVVFVGPSGCGKSTTLRMIAGLEDISSGELLIDDVVINNLAPKDRDISMVFQNYALYSHMTVYHNMAFSLALRKVNSDEIYEKVMWAADILGLKPYLNRKPANLSGGQRQRVAVGRAIVRQPKVFLLDEPLSNLDAKLRGVMRKELKELHNRLKATMVYVTHDQIEALTLADKIVVMKDGYIQQIGSPIEIYNNPANVFVASFIGTPPTNILDAKVTNEGKLFIGEKEIDIKGKAIEAALKNQGYFGKEVTIGVRPEHLIVEKVKNAKENDLLAKVTGRELLGSDVLVYYNIEGHNVISKVKAREKFEINDFVKYEINIDKAFFFDKESELRIYESK